MAPHTHNLECLEERGGRIVCSITGLGARKPAPKKVRVRWGRGVYDLTAADVEEWRKWNFVEAPLGSRVGKRVYEEHQGDWYKSPWNPSGPYQQYLSDDEKTKLIYSVDEYSKLDRREIEYELKRGHAGGPPKNDMSHWKALMAASKAIGWPSAYVRDLTFHDKHFLAKRATWLPFGWMLRESGTQLITPERGNPAESIAMYLNSFGPNARWYHWDGRSLTEMTNRQLGQQLDMDRDRVLGRTA
jgi:hypothetical protein